MQRNATVSVKYHFWSGYFWCGALTSVGVGLLQLNENRVDRVGRRYGLLEGGEKEKK